ncbi:MAG: glycerophosphodiester phosphodiesterase family protein [Hyphomonas sp.]|nr:glycerophosphodiester phosphodiesterase family protein [Hyphomonas sp.]
MSRAFTLTDFIYAHRGLWSRQATPENTASAFRAAAEHGLGMEFDIRPAADGELMVFHDETLERMAGRPDRIEDLSSRTLCDIRIAGEHPVPTFQQLLDTWPGELPLLTEMKLDGRTDPVEFGRQTGDMLRRHDGLAAAMSFSEAAVRALPADVMRGQLIAPSHKIGRSTFNDVLQRARSDGIDYVAINISDVPGIREQVPADYPIVTWTVRSLDEVRSAVHENVAIIFEHLHPGLVSAYGLS